jgi:hypothetical protein
MKNQYNATSTKSNNNTIRVQHEVIEKPQWHKLGPAHCFIGPIVLLPVLEELIDPSKRGYPVLYKNPICSGALRSGVSAMGLSPI